MYNTGLKHVSQNNYVHIHHFFAKYTFTSLKIYITKTLRHLGQQGPSSPVLCDLAAATEET